MDMERPAGQNREFFWRTACLNRLDAVIERIFREKRPLKNKPDSSQIISDLQIIISLSSKKFLQRTRTHMSKKRFLKNGTFFKNILWRTGVEILRKSSLETKTNFSAECFSNTFSRSSNNILSMFRTELVKRKELSKKVLYRTGNEGVQRIFWKERTWILWWIHFKLLFAVLRGISFERLLLVLQRTFFQCTVPGRSEGKKIFKDVLRFPSWPAGRSISGHCQWISHVQWYNERFAIITGYRSSRSPSQDLCLRLQIPLEKRSVIFKVRQ